MRFFLGIIMVIGAIGLSLMVVAPRVESIQDLRVREQSLSSALDNARRLDQTRQQLLDRYNAFDSANLDRLKTMLPGNIDNVKLIIELDALAGQYGLSLQNISVAEDKNNRDVQVIEQGGTEYGKVKLTFSVKGSYLQFVGFLENLEKSLRIIDVRELSFQATELNDVYQYNFVIETYWLK